MRTADCGASADIVPKPLGTGEIFLIRQWIFAAIEFQQELALLYRNLGDGSFADTTRPTGAGQGTLPHVNWGTDFVDFDNDGDRDLFVACGHFEVDIRKFDDSNEHPLVRMLYRLRCQAEGIKAEREQTDAEAPSETAPEGAAATGEDWRQLPET